mmetsp:Transcript_41580/g.114565  ORF Transcript_41580/g.114565 Transcript_41580/m.114565 type:complete len:244 (+) Transcript_41580:1408-2139(+)
MLLPLLPALREDPEPDHDDEGQDCSGSDHGIFFAEPAQQCRHREDGGRPNGIVEENEIESDFLAKVITNFADRLCEAEHEFEVTPRFFEAMQSGSVVQGEAVREQPQALELLQEQDVRELVVHDADAVDMPQDGERALQVRVGVLADKVPEVCIVADVRGARFHGWQLNAKRLDAFEGKLYGILHDIGEELGDPSAFAYAHVEQVLAVGNGLEHLDVLHFIVVKGCIGRWHGPCTDRRGSLSG